MEFENYNQDNDKILNLSQQFSSITNCNDQLVISNCLNKSNFDLNVIIKKNNYIKVY